MQKVENRWMRKLEMWMRAETGGSDESGNWRYKTRDWRLETGDKDADYDDKGRTQQ